MTIIITHIYIYIILYVLYKNIDRYNQMIFHLSCSTSHPGLSPRDVGFPAALVLPQLHRTETTRAQQADFGEITH